MAELDHIFQASGEACAICAALDGTPVSAGFEAHDNCTCQTIPVDEGGDCEHQYENPTRSGPNATYGVEVTVICADGSEISMSTEVDLHGAGGSEDAVLSIVEEALEEVADELCQQCPEPKPWLCC